jgi:hypothetical protein
VVSGQAAHCDTLDELLRFIARVLIRRRTEPPAAAPEDL